MLVSSSARLAPPLKRPATLASLTTPLARAPLGMATLPSISTGDSTVAVKESPERAVFELMIWSRTTGMTVSAGTTRGLGSSAFLIALVADSPVDGDELEAELELASASGPACWFAGFWILQPAKRSPKECEQTRNQPQRRIIKNSSWRLG